MRISSRLLLIIALCLLPTLALQLFVSWRQWEGRKAQLDALVQQQAQLLAGNVEGIADNARTLLGAAALYSQVRGAGPECNERLASLARQAPGFAFLALVRPDGRIACASDAAVVAGQDGADWTRQAVAVPGFVAGRFIRTPERPHGLLPFFLPGVTPGTSPAANPAPSAEGPEASALVAALDLEWLARYLARLKRSGLPSPTSGILTVTDPEGVVLGRDTRHEEFVGRSLPAAAKPMLEGTRPGALRLRSIDGTYRLVGFVPPVPATANLAVAVGFDEADLLADIQQILLGGAALLGAVGLAVFGLTLLVARRFIAAPTRALLETARHWREGDLAARTPAGSQRGSEFGQLAGAFNSMADALQKRDEELRLHAEALEARVAERTLALTQANERLRVEVAERLSTAAALRQAQKMEAVGQLAGGIAHDFNNVLQAVAGGAALIRRRAAEAASVERLAGMVEDAARRGQSVTRRLLAFARREELQADCLDMTELLRGLQEVLDAALGGGLDVALELGETPLPPVLADRGQLETVLVNLATNARDAMPRGGRLTLRAAAERWRHEDAARPEGLAPGPYVRLTVVDTGEGMHPVVLARAAEPFYTTKPLGKGTGLGLAMAKSFAEGSGGALAIDSRPGEGTRVTLWLPVAGAAGPGGDAGAPDRAAGRAGLAMAQAQAQGGIHPPRALLVDDEPVVREVLAEQLEEAGFEVVGAEDGTAALALLAARAGGPGFDILITDLAMPGMDGVSLIREAQRLRAGMPAILITGYAGDAAALAAGGVAGLGVSFTLVRKPVSGSELADQAAALLCPRQADRFEAVR